MNFVRIFFLFIFTFSPLKTGIAAQSILVPSIKSGVSLDLAAHRKSKLSNINYQLEFILPSDHTDPIPAMEIVSFSLSDASQPLILDFLEIISVFILKMAMASPIIINAKVMIIKGIIIEGSMLGFDNLLIVAG